MPRHVHILTLEQFGKFPLTHIPFLELYLKKILETQEKQKTKEDKALGFSILLQLSFTTGNKSETIHFQ